MVHDLSQYAFELPDIEEWLAGDDRTLAFQVVDADGNGIDIGSATVSWSLFEREYQTDSGDAVISGSDSDVELVTDSRVDTSIGEWEVRVDGEATDDLYGEYWHRPEVEMSDGTVAKWKGTAIITA
jgi:hypothetical protein